MKNIRPHMIYFLLLPNSVGKLLRAESVILKNIRLTASVTLFLKLKLWAKKKSKLRILRARL
jgi:hypothetical protein